ncbi:MAG: carbamoyl-phosphate synthase large subunit [Fibromonadaceae bacterium]|jgi:carbamoyl-phosphate synthase large subunit|nr:carbamoyl-phosphate synthase large subunit [Fibromonadaceae bacterium]
MPKRNDIKKILLIGSGPIIIGQACEFDYSGTQACKSLKAEGYEIVLVNSNPATIMTDPDFADRTYIEPLTVDALREIIRRERPDALLPTLGGQTALNLAMELADKSILDFYGVEMLGASSNVIRKAEDRGLFKKAMRNIGLEMPRSEIAHSYEEACQIKERLNIWPLVIRPGFTLGGTGGGIARNEEEFKEICERGLYYSPTKELLIEESIEGWKEIELELIRDSKDNCIIVCSIENLDPMGVHTGDSITIAPALTLTSKEYKKLCDAGVAIMREIGIKTGGSNVQFAVNPVDGRQVVIEMNPRVSRSSALASKATGFPIAKITAKLAVGYTLDEIANDMTKETNMNFEPSIDYIVTKIPRFAFEKFMGADDKLGTQMKSVGEAMAIGRTFKQSFQKALRSMEIGRAGFGADGKDCLFKNLSEEELEKGIRIGSANRIFMVREAITRKWSIEKIFNITKIDPWFLRQMAELVEYEEEIRSAKNLNGLAADHLLFEQAKEFGFSDKQIAHILGEEEENVRNKRKEINLRPEFHAVDTCAAEHKSFVPYLYSGYSSGGHANASNLKPSSEIANSMEKKKILILGGGPNRIGQGIEFDYCCVHASFALRKAGFETIMLNSNPETVSTDYDTSDKLYFEPLTLEDVLEVYEHEKCFGAIVQFGGQTPLNLAEGLKANGVNIIGTSPSDIGIAEDRELFSKMLKKLCILQPSNGLAKTVEEAEKIAEQIGYPILMRPSFVLGGRAMVIVYDKTGLLEYMSKAMEVSGERAILIDSFLENATEVDVDCLSDGETQVIGGIMEHVELAGVHSGDSACTIPPVTLSEEIQNTIREHTKAMAKELNVCGLMNVQYAVQNGKVYVLEVNPRASRTVPFVSKATGIPLAKIASLCMAGKKLSDIGFTKEYIPPHFSVKEAVFPFARFPGVDIILSPEMKSTGEVMGIDRLASMAYLKSQIASGNKVPESGNIFLSLRSEDREAAIPYIKRLADLGFNLYCTRRTSTVLRDNGIKSNAVFKVADGRPNAIDLIEEGKLAWVVNTPTKGKKPANDEMRIRTSCLVHGISITTTLHGLQRTVEGLEAVKKLKITDVCSLQEYSRRSPVVEV